MSSFFYIFSFSYAVGLIGGGFIKNKNYRSAWDFAKGFGALVLSRLYLNTGLALLASTVGVTLGHAWPATGRFKERDANMTMFGALAGFSVTSAALSLLAFLVLRRLLGDRGKAALATGSVLPLALVALRKPDSLILTSVFIFLVSLIQFLPRGDELNGNNKRRFLRRSVLIRGLEAFGILSLVLLVFFNRYVYKGFGMQIDIIRNGPRELGFVALTFDDGPDPVYTPRILDILKEKGVPATFFLVGSNAVKYPDIVRRIYREGHSVGNHTYSHRSLIPLSKEGVYNEIIKCDDALQRITGVKPTLFRPPRGVYTQYAREVLKENRHTMVLWDVSSRDWEEIRHTEIVSSVMRNVKPGSIILMHDSGDIITAFGGNRINTVRALPVIIDRLRAQGYDFLTIDQMLVLSGLSETEDDGSGRDGIEDN